MAVEFIGQAIHVYQGLSADLKPTDGVPLGSTFQELDGSKDYSVLTLTGWRVLSFQTVGNEASVLDVLERIQQQLAKINEDENLAPGDRHYGSN